MSDDEQQLDEFEGFIELLPEAIASNPDQIFNESIEESGSIHEELEGVAEALKSLSPSYCKDFDLEFKDITDSNLASLDYRYESTQGKESSNRDSLVSRRIQHFSQIAKVSLNPQAPKMTPGASGKAPAVPVVVTETQQLFEEIEDNVDLALTRLKNQREQRIKDMTEGEEEENLANARAFLDRLNRMQATLDEYDQLFRRKCLAIERAKRGQVREKIAEYEELLCELKSIAYSAGADPGARAAIPAQVPKFTKIAPVTLPKFGGNHAKYRAWKKSWLALARSAGIEPAMLGFRLHESLEGEARIAIGADNVWLDRDQELWRKLDGRYGNRWTVISEILKASILSQPPSDFNDIKKWVDDQLDSIQRVLQLKLTPEQLIVNCILVKLPEYIAAPLRLSLKVSGAGGGECTYSAQEFEDAVNDTIQTWTPTTPELAQSLAVHHTSFNQQANTQYTRTSSYNGRGGSTGGGNTHTTSYNGRGGPTGRGGWRGRASYRGTTRTPGYVDKCKLCDGDHYYKFCQNYKGALAKRERLKALGRCPECSSPKHDGQACLLRYPCHNCTGDTYHLDFLCPCIATPDS